MNNKFGEQKKPNAWFYNELEAVFKRLSLTFQDYFDKYASFVEEYEIKTDGNELQFVELELQIFEDVQGFLQVTGQSSEHVDKYAYYKFEETYREYFKYVQAAILSDKTSNSLESKCKFLIERKSELETIPISNTLKQRLLLLYYLEQAHKLNLTSIHPDQKGQAKILSFLMNSSLQKTRKGLGEVIRSRNKNDLKLLFKQVDSDPEFEYLTSLIRKDLEKLS